MGFGVGDFLWIIGGGAWLTQHGARSFAKGVRDLNDTATRCQNYNATIRKTTDYATEQKYMALVDDEEHFDELWQTLEEYKRDNPVACYLCDVRYTRSKVLSNWWYSAFRWAHVGKQRVMVSCKGKRQVYAMIDAYKRGSKTTRSVSDKFCAEWVQQMRVNGEHMVDMLMQIHGKRSSNAASQMAAQQYGIS